MMILRSVGMDKIFGGITLIDLLIKRLPTSICQRRRKRTRRKLYVIYEKGIIILDINNFSSQ